MDEATAELAKILQAKCQPDESLTPTGRLAAMEDRLQAMLKALDTTQAALSKILWFAERRTEGAIRPDQRAGVLTAELATGFMQL